MNDEEIERLCHLGFRQKLRKRLTPFWTAEVYGLGRQIREYGRYPSWLPICLETDHGINLLDYPLKTELDSTAPCILFHNSRHVPAWKEQSKKKCYVMISPFVLYRRQKGIEKSAGAKGTLVFPAHSTPGTAIMTDYKEYIERLMELPKEFQPVSVCLHYWDIINGDHKEIAKYKLPVYTAGNPFDYRFIERFYNILKGFEYTMSNSIGSYTFYSVEMGIPFSMYGKRAQAVNTSDINLPLGVLAGPEWEPHFRHYYGVAALFEGLFTSITREQRETVEYHLGIHEGISRKEMSTVLYRSLLEYVSRGLPRHALSLLRQRIKHFSSSAAR